MKPAIILGMMLGKGAPEIAETLLLEHDVEFITLEPITTEFARRGLPSRSFDEFVEDGPENPLLAEGVQRLQRAREVIQSAGLRAAYAHLDEEAWAAVQQTLLEGLRHHLVPCMLHAEGVRRCADETDLRLLVFNEDVMPHSRTMITTASAAGVPSLHMVHGILCGAITPHPAISASHIAAFSEHNKRQYEFVGADPASIHVTGNPAWDRLGRPPQWGARAEVCERLGLDASAPVITYALTDDRVLSMSCLEYPQRHTQLARAMLDAFAELQQRHPDWQFAMRPRLNYDTDPPLAELVETARGRGLKHVFIDTSSAYDSLVLSDLMISTESNIGIEAILLGKYAMDVSIPEYGGRLFHEGVGSLWDDEDAIIRVTQADQIASRIEPVLLDPAVRAGLDAARPHSVERFNQPHDARACQRVAALVARLARLEPGGDKSAFAQTCEELRAPAAEHNRAGEARFMQGDVEGALRHFVRALNHWDLDPAYSSNLGTALHAAGRPQDAWDAFVAAMHQDPHFQPARDNLRAVAPEVGRMREAERILWLFGSDE